MDERKPMLDYGRSDPLWESPFWTAVRFAGIVAIYAFFLFCMSIPQGC